ncbi:hypothetical protein SAMN02745830_06300 [Streptomyces sp. Amel2xC10]|nr:hypothetical protein SAMN02745830_06300 [Streptomyces sp. Amel2xC10]
MTATDPAAWVLVAAWPNLPGRPSPRTAVHG